MEKNSLIYVIKNITNDKRYVGSAVNFYNRKKQHLSLLKRGLHHSVLLQRAWNKYGEKSFVFEILEKVSDIKQLIEKEQYYLDFYESYNSKNGYNICNKAGNTLGFKHSDKTKKLMSLNHTGVSTRPCSNETKNKISKTKSDSDLSKAVIKRKKTLLRIDKNIFKLIGEKSSKTQRINGFNKGANNPNSNKGDVLILNEFGNIIFITNNAEFKELCEEHDLPIRVLLKSKISNGKYKLYLNQKPRNEEYLKYKGWSCKYK